MNPAHPTHPTHPASSLGDELHDADDSSFDEPRGFRGRLGERLESKTTHRVVLSLIAIDASFVLTSLAYCPSRPIMRRTMATADPLTPLAVLRPPTCPPNDPHPHPIEETPDWLEVMESLSLAIMFVFLIEIPLDLYAFGPRYFGLSLKRRAVPHAGLHLFDAIVIVGTIIVETSLRGTERELAGLLVLLRLWRLIKLGFASQSSISRLDLSRQERGRGRGWFSHLYSRTSPLRADSMMGMGKPRFSPDLPALTRCQVGGVAVGVGDWDEEAMRKLAQKDARIKALEGEVATLRAGGDVSLTS
ncbi:hypothetical protein JCM24511_08201 [Saitozyma sp. JCM 24511]|nr:hypothetical protein JCM24511_08201 [Saitozyma sp. JCM 24511]